MPTSDPFGRCTSPAFDRLWPAAQPPPPKCAKPSKSSAAKTTAANCTACCGATPATNCKAGDAAKLVAFLGNDNLDFRVLAFANLQEICHLTFNYRPDAPAASREGPLGRWQEQQRKGLIVPK